MSALGLTEAGSSNTKTMSAQKPIARMWCFLFVITILFLTVICKEYAPEVKLGDDELNRIYNMVKRLEKKSGNDPKDRVPIGISGHGDESTAESTGVRSELCGVTENDGSIIRTNDSIHNGAQFLEVFRDALTQGACADRCCERSSCDTAVFEKEGEHKCFLFHCQGRCQFSRHNNFTSVNIHRHESSSPSSTSHPASAAAGNNETDRVEASSDSVTSSTPAVSGSATTFVSAHSGGKCPSGSFECQTPVDGDTQCIAQEMVCDSIRQCVDGSDEGSCSHTGAFPLDSQADDRLLLPESKSVLFETQTPQPQLEQRTLLPSLQSSQLSDQDKAFYLQQLPFAAGAVSASQSVAAPGTFTSLGISASAQSGPGPVQEGYEQGGSLLYSLDLSGQQQPVPESSERGGWPQFGVLPGNHQKGHAGAGSSPLRSQHPGNSASSEDVDLSHRPVVSRVEEQVKERGEDNVDRVDAGEMSGVYAQYLNHPASEELYPVEHSESAEDYHKNPDDVQEESENMYEDYPSSHQQKSLLKMYNYQTDGELSGEHEPSEFQREWLQTGHFGQQLSTASQFSGSSAGGEPFNANSFYDSHSNFQSQHVDQSPHIDPQELQSMPMLKSVDVKYWSKQDASLSSSKRAFSGAAGQPLRKQKQKEKNIEQVEGDSDSEQHNSLSRQQDVRSSGSGESAGHQALGRMPVTSVLYSIHGKSGAGQEDAGASPEDQVPANLVTASMAVNQQTLEARPYGSVYSDRGLRTDAAGQQLHTPQADYAQNDHHLLIATSPPLHSPVKVNSTGLQTSLPEKEANSSQRESQASRPQVGHNSSLSHTSLVDSEKDHASHQLYPADEDQGVRQEGVMSGPPSFHNRGAKQHSLYSGRGQYSGSQEGSVPGTESQGSEGPQPTQGGPPNNGSKDALHKDRGHLSQEDKQGPGDVSQNAQTDLLEEKKNKTESEKDGKQTEDNRAESQPSTETKTQPGSTEGQSSETKEETTEEHSTKSSEEPKMESTPSSAEGSTPTPMSSTASTSAVSTHTDKHFISKEKMDSTEINDLQMPIIALSVGLAFTLILLIFVACRLCKVRRQLRKGRPLHSNEADYLINGMYL